MNAWGQGAIAGLKGDGPNNWYEVDSEDFEEYDKGYRFGVVKKRHQAGVLHEYYDGNKGKGTWYTCLGMTSIFDGENWSEYINTLQSKDKMNACCIDPEVPCYTCYWLVPEEEVARGMDINYDPS